MKATNFGSRCKSPETKIPFQGFEAIRHPAGRMRVCGICKAHQEFVSWYRPLAASNKVCKRKSFGQMAHAADKNTELRPGSLTSTTLEVCLEAGFREPVAMIDRPTRTASFAT